MSNLETLISAIVTGALIGAALAALGFTVRLARRQGGMLRLSWARGRRSLRKGWRR